MVVLCIWIVVFAGLWVLTDILKYIRYFVWLQHNEIKHDDKTLKDFIKFMKKK